MNKHRKRFRCELGIQKSFSCHLLPERCPYNLCTLILKELQKKLTDDKPNVKDVKSTNDKIARFPSEKVHKKPTMEHGERVLKTREDVERSIEGYKVTLEKQIEKAKKFYEAVEIIEAWKPKIEEILEEKEQVTKDQDTLKTQLKKLDVSLPRMSLPIFGYYFQ